MAKKEEDTLTSAIFNLMDKTRDMVIDGKISKEAMFELDEEISKVIKKVNEIKQIANVL